MDSASAAPLPLQIPVPSPEHSVPTYPKHFIVRVLHALRRFLETRILEPILTLTRAIHLIILLSPILFLSPIALSGSRDRNAYGQERSGTLWWYDIIVGQMQRAGPTFIKLAQWAATRTDLFPIELCRRLSRLHSRAQAHPFHETRALVEAAFGGKTLEELFSSFDPEPLGVGAIAQVYKATFRKESLPHTLPCTVAIKVLHPGAEEQVQRDLRLMSILAHGISLIPGCSWLALPDEVDVFGEMMRAQLDLRIEAEHLQRFKEGFKYRYEIHFPKSFSGLTESNVLVEEYVEGIPMRKFLESSGTSYDRAISGIGLDAFLHMLIIDNFVHADLHPGNIIVQLVPPPPPLIYLRRRFASYFNLAPPTTPMDREAVHRLSDLKDDDAALQEELNRLWRKGYLPQLVFLDAGLVTELDEKNRRNFLDLFQAVAEFDGYRAGTLMVERCQSPELAIEPEEFARGVQGLVERVRDQTMSLSQVHIADILTVIMHLVREHHVRLAGDFVNVFVSILILEGIGRRLNPDLDLLKVALPILRDVGRVRAEQGLLEGAKDRVLPGREVLWGAGLFLRLWVWMETVQWVSVQWGGREELRISDLFVPDV
ncbi:atypical/ABC1/ABC1-C protein kinase [Piptocephalis cylindrospora]|uniref:Atypical/ABC1/ABC1-C protein kinase n=1 Tax=Piptocephalis cylindrospora TaxID=1907219 RepID=A0A4P9Y689_9FUNG|nr:atypical/ABC1/ABC1-C protein kinase [Piptocephalis cylindrospora]|eukprot:RKP14588.1 atypical/ABC1/ABC1-C protein kinase [Piptocephalis cylindrospora]